MSTPAPHLEHFARQIASQAVASQPVDAASAGAANDPAVTEEDADDHFNPMWLIAIAMACTFGAMAVLMVSG